MVKLTNITLNGTVMSCDYYPEHTQLKGHIVYDMDKDEMVEFTPSQYPANIEMYSSQVIGKMCMLYRNKGDIPFEAYSVWY